LQGANHVHVATGGENLEIIRSQAWRGRRRGNEILKEVQAEDDEHQSEKDPGDNGENSHDGDGKLI